MSNKFADLLILLRRICLIPSKDYKTGKIMSKFIAYQNKPTACAS